MLTGELNIKTEEGRELYNNYLRFCNKLLEFTKIENDLELKMQMIIHDHKPYKVFTCIIYIEDEHFWIGKDPISPNNSRDYIRIVLDFTENESRKKVKFVPNEIHAFVNEGHVKTEKMTLFSKVENIDISFLENSNIGALLSELEKMCLRHRIQKKFISEY